MLGSSMIFAANSGSKCLLTSKGLLCSRSSAQCSATTWTCRTAPENEWVCAQAPLSL